MVWPGLADFPHCCALCQPVPGGRRFLVLFGGSGLETAAYLHACAAHPHIREPSRLLLRQQPFSVMTAWSFAPGRMRRMPLVRRGLTVLARVVKAGLQIDWSVPAC